MDYTLSTAATLEVGDWINTGSSYQRVTEILDTPASDVEGAARFITHTGGILVMYACEPIGVQS